jgi:hypothetical protein
MYRPAETLYTVSQTLIAVSLIVCVSAAIGVQWRPDSRFLVGTLASAAVPLLALKVWYFDR